MGIPGVSEDIELNGRAGQNLSYLSPGRTMCCIFLGTLVLYIVAEVCSAGECAVIN